MTIYTKVYLPEVYPLPNILNETNVFYYLIIIISKNYPGFPSYFVDFTLNVKVKIPSHIPYQELPLDSTELYNYVSIITEPTKKG